MIKIFASILFMYFCSSASFADNTDENNTTKSAIAIIYKEGLASIDNKDVRLAMNLLLQEVTAKSQYKIQTKFLDNPEKIVKEFQNAKVNLLILDFINYLKNYEKINSSVKDRWILLSKKDNTLRRFYLLVNKKSAINSLKDLQSKTIGLLKYDSMQKLFLDYSLLKDQNQTSDTFFKEKKLFLKPSRALIKLFFNKIDACIVSEYAWDTAVEINPQFKKRLKIIQKSKDIFPPVALILIHKNSPFFSKLYEKFVFTSQMNSKSKQILNMYQAVQSVNLSEKEVQPIYTYYKEYLKLKNRPK